MAQEVKHHGAISTIFRGMDKLNGDMLAVMRVLADSYDRYYGFGYMSFDAISNQTNIPKKRVRVLVRRLARMGFAHYSRGLFNEDGEVAGSGYSATMEGVTAIKIMG